MRVDVWDKQGIGIAAWSQVALRREQSVTGGKGVRAKDLRTEDSATLGWVAGFVV